MRLRGHRGKKRCVPVGRTAGKWAAGRDAKGGEGICRGAGERLTPSDAGDGRRRVRGRGQVREKEREGGGSAGEGCKMSKESGTSRKMGAEVKPERAEERKEEKRGFQEKEAGMEWRLIAPGSRN